MTQRLHCPTCGTATPHTVDDSRRACTICGTSEDRRTGAWAAPGDNNRDPLEVLADGLRDLDLPFVHDDGDEGRGCLAVTLGLGEAIEITPTWPRDGMDPNGHYFTIHHRQWDRTHGLAAEKLLAVADAVFAPAAVRMAVAKHNADMEAVVAAMEAPEREDRIQQLWGMLMESRVDTVADRHHRYSIGYYKALIDAFCTITGESPEMVNQRLTAPDAERADARKGQQQ